ncbi:MAG: alkaline phosphatase family protein [Planctomycetota bacterium]
MDRSSLRWGLSALIVLGLLIAGVMLLARRESGPKVLLVGIDGAEWDVINPLIEQGRLPNLARLKREGIYGTLRSFEPILSPIIWTSIATGKTPEKHGIGWFMVQSEKTGRRLPVTSRVRKCQALWNILSARSLSSGIVGWWATYPAEEVDGFIVTDFLAYHNFGLSAQDVKSDLGKTYPLELIEEIDPLLVSPKSLDPELVTRFASVPREELEACLRKDYDFADPLSHFLHILATAETYTAVGTTLYEREKPDLFAVYYEAVDSCSHLFMKYADPALPEVSAERRERYGHLVERFYEYQDEVLGRYLALAGDDTFLIVVSDHGFKTGAERPREGDEIRVGMAHEWHNIDGVILMKGPGVKEGAEIPEASVLDVTPTILYALGLPVADDMDGSVILDAFRPSYLAAHKITRIPSYEDGAAPAQEAEVDEGIARAMEQRLTQLGYVAANADESSPEIHLNLAQRCLESGKLAEAERELRIAARMGPGMAGPHAMLAQVYRQQQRLADAKKELEFAIALAPEALDLRMRHYGLCAELGEHGQALASLKEVEKRAPDWPGVQVSLGDVYNRLGRLEEAEAALRRALAARPDGILAHFNLGVVLGNLGRNEEAAAEFRRVLDVQPSNSYALNNLAAYVEARMRAK